MESDFINSARVQYTTLYKRSNNMVTIFFSKKNSW